MEKKIYSLRRSRFDGFNPREETHHNIIITTSRDVLRLLKVGPTETEIEVVCLLWGNMVRLPTRAGIDSGCVGSKTLH